MITLDHTAFRAAVADVRTTADRLRDDRDRVARQVDGLLDAWSGAAATAYAEGWVEWQDGAARVLAGLEAMARLLEAAHGDLVETDGSSGDALARLTTRLG